MISLDKKYHAVGAGYQGDVRLIDVDDHFAFGYVGLAVGVWNVEDGTSIGPLRDRGTLTEIKPMTTRTYWLVHFARVTSLPIPVRSVHEAWSCAAQLGDASAITGPHQVKFQEGDGL